MLVKTREDETMMLKRMKMTLCAWKNNKRKKVFCDMLTRIEEADDCEISEIIRAVIRRYQRVFPDWEVVFYSLPKADEIQRRASIDGLIDMLNREKNL